MASTNTRFGATIRAAVGNRAVASGCLVYFVPEAGASQIHVLMVLILISRPKKLLE